MPRSWASLLRSTVVRDTALNSGPILSFSLDNLAPSCPDGGLTGGSPRQRRSAAKEFTSRATSPRTQHTLVGLYYHSLWGFLLIRRGALRDAAPLGEPSLLSLYGVPPRCLTLVCAMCMLWSQALQQILFPTLHLGWWVGEKC